VCNAEGEVKSGAGAQDAGSSVSTLKGTRIQIAIEFMLGKL
jgi:hypothetical protein